MASANIETLALQVAKILQDRGETIAVAESSAGGLVSAALLAVPGASAYFLGGSVVYTRPAKSALLAVPDAILDEHRSASEPHALALARAARDRLGADWGLAETGAAGPTGNRYGDAKSWIIVLMDNEETIKARAGMLSPGMTLKLREKLDPNA